MYADVPSVTKPILHSKDLPHPVCPGSSSANILDDNNSDVEFKSISSDSDEFSPQENTPHLINQAEFNDLVRDLQLSRSKAELLLLPLTTMELVTTRHKSYVFRNRSKVYSEFFKEKYKEHKWKVCGDLKVIGMLVGLQGGYTKYCCFLCLWDSRAKQHHYVRKEWPVRNEYIPGKMNINHELLVDPNNVTLPPLHIKLGLMKNFVKALDKNSDAFRYLQKIFPNITERKLKEGSMSDEQGERFHQDLRTFEERHQGFWDENMLGDYCWSIIRETDSNNYKRKQN
ncbi:hypothetical protein EVAR_66227_1 [Eumeta japonica]|uniref:Uncharacterized protein n=1 Tax=Eumeta variegata TaxID=151549 RepID=A0A4C1ZZV2_EUMVA|nr:hypothetical protein EVAR_66227_1 [Eumeta japonica]